MKGKNILFICVLVSLFCCQKSTHINEDNSIKIDYIPKAQAWIKSQKNKFDILGQKKIDSIFTITNWGEAVKNKIKFVGDLICIPLKSDEYKGYWVFIFENGCLQASNVFVIDKFYGFKSVDDIKIINSYYSNSSIEFSGKLTEFSIAGKFIREIGYKLNDRHFIKEIKSQNNNSKGQIKSNSDCTAYYWVTTWSDGSKTYEYMYTRCTGSPCEQTGIVDIKTGENKIVSNCFDGAFGGSPDIVISGDEIGPILKNLCTPSYGWVATGVNGFTVQVNNLVAPFQRDDRSLSATVVFNEACITLPISAV
jgi:hypothetical protein